MGEIRDLLISAFVLALAFSIMFAGGLKWSVLSLFPVSLMTVSVGFVFHELAHRYAARSFGCFAEYRMWPPGLLLALLFAPLGVVFAAPGAVMIWPRVDIWARPIWLGKREYGIVSLLGPLANMSLALTFFLLRIPFPSTITSLGARVNAGLAFFNLLPLTPLDGSKVFRWNKVLWGVAMVVAIAMLLFF